MEKNQGDKQQMKTTSDKNKRIFSMMDGMMASADKKNSMAYWYPKIKKLARTPETIIIPIDKSHYYKVMYQEDGISTSDLAKFYNACTRLGFPVFMRTSHSSDKHHWKETCFVNAPDKLKQNICRLLEHDFLNDLVPDAIIFRKFIPMESYFTAWYGDFPVNKEIRCFINNGKIECIHPYWFEDAVKQGERWVSDKNWRQKMKLITEISNDDNIEIRSMLEKVIPKFDNEWWSVDFAKSKDGDWHLIDMAVGLASYHYDSCPNKPIFEEKIK